MKYLIDTDWIIDHFNNVIETVAKLEELASQGVAISVVSLAELYEGVYYSRDMAKSQKLLNEFLAPDLNVLGIDENVCRVFGQQRGKLRKEKKLINDFDLLIASTALHYNLIVLSNNRKHFEKTEGLKIISLQLKSC